jgi:FMN-dependent NADH-azoreductase
MKTLLVIQGSPRGERSHSIAVADAFVKSYIDTHSGDCVQTLNVFDEPLPEFGPSAVSGKYALAMGQELDAAQRAVWEPILRLIEQFRAADKFLFAVPMWNFDLPYRLKQYLDLITQPRYTFAYEPGKGYTGLVAGRPACAIYARGSDYGDGSGREMLNLHQPALENILHLIGFDDIQSITVQPTMAGGPELARDRQQAAILQAQTIAMGF